MKNKSAIQSLIDGQFDDTSFAQAKAEYNALLAVVEAAEFTAQHLIAKRKQQSHSRLINALSTLQSITKG